MMSRFVLAPILIVASATSGVAQKRVQDFKARQCGGDEALFQLSAHRGTWVLLDFLLPVEDATEAAHYTAIESKSAQLLYEHNILPVFLKPNETEATAKWWGSLPTHSLPIFRDPDGKLASALGIPKGVFLMAGPAHYPAAILIDPDGNEVWRKTGKKAADRVDLETLRAEIKRAKVERKMAAGEEDRDPWDPEDPRATTTPSGLMIVEIAEGKGMPAKVGRSIRVHYTGWLTDGTKFDSSRDRGAPFELRLGAGQVIKGWDEGLLHMKEGGIRKLIIPPDLAYGDRSQGKIPPNSTLVFAVEMVEIK
jgi:FKBP-type peptidyl-prolyl cis-trans isomerase